MRISGGSAKGRNVRIRRAFSTEGSPGELRPTSAKVRKAVFDILQDRLFHSRFVDLYAGTGAVGIEALSRGAAEVTFVESSSVRIRLIRDLATKFLFDDRARLVRDSALRFLQTSVADKAHGSACGSYDIVFADPPYCSEEIEKLLSVIGGARMLKEGGTLIVEHPSKKLLPAVAGALSLLKVYRYGDTALSVYRSCASACDSVTEEVRDDDR